MNYREPLFRPPAEADSLIFQVVYGCPHNTCRFCGMYKGVRYDERSLEDVSAEIADAATLYPDERRIFLADGDVMALPFEKLRAILAELSDAFPRLSRVSVYANGSSILAKTESQLRELRALKLHTLYIGLESGDEDTLLRVRKGETAAGMTEAVRNANSAGFRCSVMFLLGVAGKSRSAEHAAATAATLNAMRPKLLSALRYVSVLEGALFDGFQVLSEYEAVRELRDIIANLELPGTIFRANHTSNPVPLSGRFPQDKERLVAELEVLMASSALNRSGPGHMPFPGML